MNDKTLPKGLSILPLEIRLMIWKELYVLQEPRTVWVYTEPHNCSNHRPVFPTAKTAEEELSFRTLRRQRELFERNPNLLYQFPPYTGWRLKVTDEPEDVQEPTAAEEPKPVEESKPTSYPRIRSLGPGPLLHNLCYESRVYSYEAARKAGHILVNSETGGSHDAIFFNSDVDLLIIRYVPNSWNEEVSLNALYCKTTVKSFRG